MMLMFFVWVILFLRSVIETDTIVDGYLCWRDLGELT